MIEHKKLLSMLKEITLEKCKVTLFGLFLREGASHDWDLFIAGPWVDNDYMGRIDIDKKLKAHLNSDELLSLYRIVILESHYPVLEAILMPCRRGRKKLNFAMKISSGWK